MKEEQIKNLKEMMARYKMMSGELKREYLTQILAYLDGCLDGLAEG